MSRSGKIWLKFLLLAVWLLMATVIYMAIWSRNVEYFQYSNWIADVVEGILGFVQSFSNDEIVNIETWMDFYFFGVSFVSVSIITFVGYVIWFIAKEQWRTQEKHSKIEME